jgi:hypothetical protein
MSSHHMRDPDTTEVTLACCYSLSTAGAELIDNAGVERLQSVGVRYLPSHD